MRNIINLGASGVNLTFLNQEIWNDSHVTKRDTIVEEGKEEPTPYLKKDIETNLDT